MHFRRIVAIVAIYVFAVLGPGTCAYCHDDAKKATRKDPDQRVHRPTAAPDRIVLSWVGDPATSQAVTWRTDATVVRAIAAIALATDGPIRAEQSSTIDAVTTRLVTDRGEVRCHWANFQRLQPKTRYAYRVGDGVNWSEWSHFATAGAPGESFSFVYFGDAQNDIKSHWSRVIREAYRDAPKAAFLLHAGDLVNRSDRDDEWGEWFYAGGFIHRTVPCIATPGNHEYHKSTGPGADEKSRMLSRHWRNTFAFPENGPPELAETAYWMDYQGVRIISLNSNERLDEQAAWLGDVLVANRSRWTVITFHHPIYSSKKGRDNAELRRLWQPVFDRFGVDLVLQGHDHTYARSELMSQDANLTTGATARSGNAGTVYVVSVSGPKMYDLGAQPFMRRVAEDTQLYQIISISGGQLDYEARTATGRLYDGFTLRKRPGKVNELVERIPSTPEIRRPAEKSAAGS